MGEVVSSLFGGRPEVDNSEALDAQRRSQQQQRVANDRQLAQSTRENSKASARRRPPRGRRLFEDGAGGLASSLGD